MAGADFIETNTFNGTAISQADYDTQHLVSNSNTHTHICMYVCVYVHETTHGICGLNFSLLTFDSLVVLCMAMHVTIICTGTKNVSYVQVGCWVDLYAALTCRCWVDLDAGLTWMLC